MKNESVTQKSSKISSLRDDYSSVVLPWRVQGGTQNLKKYINYHNFFATHSGPPPLLTPYVRYDEYLLKSQWLLIHTMKIIYEHAWRL